MKLYIILCETDYDLEICYDGRRPYMTSNFSYAKDYKLELEQHCKELGQKATYFIKEITEPQ